MRALKEVIRRGFFRSELVRWGVGAGRVLSGSGGRLGLSHLLAYRNEDEIGPLQRDEALFLFGLLRVTRPRLVVEFGFFHGHSAFNFLRALGPKARLVSFDIKPESKVRAESEFAHFRNFQYIEKSQAEFDPSDLRGEKADFVFIDASHDLELNQATFARLLPALSPMAIIAVHDTGLWHRAYFLAKHHAYAAGKEERWLSKDLYQAQIDERHFVNWIMDDHPEFAQIHFHTTDVLRHGLTLLQRHQRLPTQAE
ncbi:MAG: O-methyltransferase [Verrucomicrobiales bacterium]